MKPHKTFTIALALAALAGRSPAQIAAADRRNLDIPNTDTHFTAPAFSSLASWEMRRRALVRQILFAAGLSPLPVKTPLHPQIFGRLEREGYTVEKVLLETLPGYYLGGNLYRPRGAAGRFPAIVTPHGHWDYGRLENSAINSVPGRCINLARQGFVVFSYDMVGQNDTLQTPHEFLDRRQQLWSFGPLGLQLWNSLRAVDFVASLPDADPQRIAATGASGGATQVLLLQAIDPRIRWSAPVNMISLLMQGGAMCENAPGLRVGTTTVEIGALMAPRPMLMVSATGDWTHNTPREEFPAVRAIYALYGKPENVESVQIDAPHNYNRDSREAVYRFFGQWIRHDPEARTLAESAFHAEKPADLLALHNRTIPPGALSFDGVFEEWRSLSRRQTDSETVDALRDGLLGVFAAEWPHRVLSEGSGPSIALGREGKGDRVPAIWVPGSRHGSPTLLVDAGGALAARLSDRGHALVQSGAPVLFIDAFQTGAAIASRDSSGNFYTTFNRTDDANRVQDILTALRFLDAQGVGPVTLAASGRAAIWATFAAAMCPVPIRLEVNLEGFEGTDEQFLSGFFVPGIQRAGGLGAAQRILAAESAALKK